VWVKNRLIDVKIPSIAFTSIDDWLYSKTKKVSTLADADRLILKQPLESTGKATLMSDSYELQLEDLLVVEETEVGLGVFAKWPLREGMVLGEITGQLIVDSKHSSEYAIELDENVSLEPAAPFRFLNHCCQPNCELFGFDEDEQPGPLYLGVLRDLEPGDELTIDYAWPADGAIRCLCHAEHCRGWIVASEELDLILEA